MGFARFFDKTALSAASILRGFDFAEFKDKLSQCVPCLAFDRSVSNGSEGRATLSLAVDLLARLYPSIAIVQINADPTESSLREDLVAAARAINPGIEIQDQATPGNPMLVIGRTEYLKGNPTIYLGSDGWTCLASLVSAVGSGNTANPFGAGAAACFGAAFLFRLYFRDQLPSHVNGEAFALSQHDADVLRVSIATLHGADSDSRSLESFGKIEIGESFLVGVGAIGNGALWALSRVKSLSGDLHLIDREKIEVSNLQRYVLTGETSIDRQKAQIGAESFEEFGQNAAESPLRLFAHACDWREFISKRRNYDLNRVLLALDSAGDRVLVQGSLPRWIANAWTQPENLGVSRHHFLGPQACVACLYMPNGPSKSEDVLYAEALGLTEPRELMEIRSLLHSGRPVGMDFLTKIALRLGIPLEAISSYSTRPLRHFYSHGLCGGVILELGGQVGPTRHMEAPMAFQSALAGILLAADLVLESAGARNEMMPCRSEIDLLRAIGNRISSPEGKHVSGRCICQDPAYVEAYVRKYSIDKRTRNSRAA